MICRSESELAQDSDRATWFEPKRERPTRGDVLGLAVHRERRLEMPCTPGEFEYFQAAEPSTLHHVRTLCCGGVLNHWGSPVPLDEPRIFGALSPDPQAFTHLARVSCACEATQLDVYGTMEVARGISCS